MTRRPFQTIAAAFLVTMLVATVGVVSADPLVVTSGVFSMGSGDPTFFQFTGDGLDLRAFVGPIPGIGPFETCFRCDPGTTIDLSSRISGAIGVAGFARFQGAEYSNVSFSGDLNFDAPTVVAPPIVAGFEEPHLGAPFLFNGQLTAFASPGGTGPALFTVALTGGGDADLVISAGPLSTSQFEFSDLNYRFTSVSPAPTPEPATLMLVAGGLLSAGVVRRRRQREK